MTSSVGATLATPGPTTSLISCQTFPAPSGLFPTQVLKRAMYEMPSCTTCRVSLGVCRRKRHTSYGARQDAYEIAVEVFAAYLKHRKEQREKEAEDEDGDENGIEDDSDYYSQDENDDNDEDYDDGPVFA